MAHDDQAAKASAAQVSEALEHLPKSLQQHVEHTRTAHARATGLGDIKLIRGREEEAQRAQLLHDQRRGWGAE